MSEVVKAIITTRWRDLLNWHTPTIISLAGTSALLYLNFRECAIGGEIGGSPNATANTLGALQVFIKMHELAIVASILLIARQWILSNLLRGGILLGLLGAEQSLSAPTFIISREYWLMLKYAAQGIFPAKEGTGLDSARRTDRATRLQMLSLAVFMFLGCGISSLAGPASGVLMVPRIGWFFGGELRFDSVAHGTMPNVMIGTAMEDISGYEFPESSVFALPLSVVDVGMHYWPNILSTSRGRDLTVEEMSVHAFFDSSGNTFINTTGSDGRILDAEWSGGTRITTSMKSGDMSDKNGTLANLRIMREGWREVRVTRTTHGLDAWVTCRAREKISCGKLSGNQSDAMVFSNHSEPAWCYMSVNKDNTTGNLRTSRNLLMTSIDEPRVWLTEGPRIEGNSHYSDSIEVILEKLPTPTDPRSILNERFMYNLTVCSFSGALVAAIATTYGVQNVAEYVGYLDHVLLANGSTAPPRKLLFHENWLDRAYGLDPAFHHTKPEDTAYPTGSMEYPDNFTYPARPGTTARDTLFGSLGWFFTSAGGFEFVNKPNPKPVPHEAFQVEMVVGGMLAYLLSWTPPSSSQYSMAYEQIPEDFRLGPAQSWSIGYVWQVYHEGYGFRLSTRTAYLGVVVLIVHSAVAITASLWQLLVRRRIISGWSSVTDYLFLGVASRDLENAYPHSCAGVTGDQALGSLVVVVESTPLLNSPTPHLEMIFNDPANPVIGDLTKSKKMYGFSTTEQEGAGGKAG